MVGEVIEDSQIIVYSPVTNVPRCNGSNAKRESSVIPVTRKIQNLKKKINNRGEIVGVFTRERVWLEATR